MKAVDVIATGEGSGGDGGGGEEGGVMQLLLKGSQMQSPLHQLAP